MVHGNRSRFRRPWCPPLDDVFVTKIQDSRRNGVARDGSYFESVLARFQTDPVRFDCAKCAFVSFSFMTEDRDFFFFPTEEIRYLAEF